MQAPHGTKKLLIRAAIGVLCLWSGSLGVGYAQTTNLAAYQNLAVRCLADVPDTVQAFRLDAPALMPYLRAALVERWQAEGHTLYLADSSFQTPGLPPPRLRYEIEQAQVEYERAGRRQMDRTVTLGLRYTFIGSDGRLLHDDRCLDTFTDTLRRADQAAVQTDAFPETQAEAPSGSWRRRLLEPAVLAAATAVTIFLFFNLRSERTDDEL